MTRPELRLIHGDDTPMNRFKTFVIKHSVEIGLDIEETRLGTYSLQDAAQLVPIDEVEFKVLDVEDAVSYYIKLNRSTDPTDPTVFEVFYDDDPDEPQFYDRSVNPISETEVMRIVANLTEAEEAGRLRPL